MEVKGGLRDPIEFITHGRVRFRVLGPDGVLEMIPVTSEPDDPHKGTGFFFFRFDGAKYQLCVQFPTGATQILATEP